MKDTIYRQAAIEIIQSMYPGMPRIPWMRKDWQKRYEPYIRTENAIRELLSAQQWVPCSERLPEEKSDWKTVTVLDESGDTPFTYTSVGYYLSDGWWIVDNEPMEEGNLIGVIAWMPLPEPYAERREECQ